MSSIIKAVTTIMGEVGSVQKAGTNDFHRYKYATAADILHKLQPLMAREGLVVFQTEQSRDLIADGSVLSVTYEFTLAHRDGDVWPTPIIRTGMSAARNTKGGFDDKALNKCQTSAHKYFHLTLFEIPTGDYDDADAEEDRNAPTVAKNGRQPAKPAPLALAVPSAVVEHDPGTGETGPRELPLPTKSDGSYDPIAFGQAFLAAINASTTAEEVGAWLEANETTTARLPRKVFDRIAVHVSNRIAALRPEAGQPFHFTVRESVDPEKLLEEFGNALKKAADVGEIDGAHEAIVLPSWDDLLPPDRAEAERMRDDAKGRFANG